MNFIDQAAVEWGIRTFGLRQIANKRIRGARFAEEAMEPAQTVGVSSETLHTLIDAVYGKNPDPLDREVGGVMTTLAVLCHTLGIDRHAAYEREVLRCLGEPPERFIQRNAEKAKLLGETS